MQKRTVHDWAILWGEWERHKRNYLSPLSYKSAMLSVTIIAVRDDAPPAPALLDEDQKWLCDVMSKIKRESNRNYRILKMKYVFGYSQERIRAYLRVSKNRSYEETELAIFYAESVIRKEMPNKLIDH